MDPEENKDATQFDGERYIKNVYNTVKAWINDDQDEATGTNATTSWIFLDDATSLSSILGDRLVYCFVESLVALVNRPGASPSPSRKCGLVARCSGDLDQMLYKTEASEGRDHTGWIGAGGLSHKQAVHDSMYRTLVPWERAMAESVDAVIDVLPLLSGFSREAHGRLIFSETPNGRGWKGFQSRTAGAAVPQSSRPAPKLVSASNKTNSSSWNKLIFNYRIQDNGARAIRLRAR